MRQVLRAWIRGELSPILPPTLLIRFSDLRLSRWSSAQRQRGCSIGDGGDDCIRVTAWDGGHHGRVRDP